MKFRNFGIRAGLALALCSTATVCPAAAPAKLTGSVLGSVKDTGGIPQIGATVLLFNRYDKLVQKAITNLRGDFLFDALTPDNYSVRVTLSSFVPALKRNILVQPGMQSVLAINLASVFSSVELVYTAPRSGALMSDDWKWALRTAMDTRPVLRALPGIVPRTGSELTIFSDTSGLLRVSSGESSPYASLGNQPDLGTAFALATSVFGTNRVQVSGNLGYAVDSAAPNTAFRATFSHGEPGVPGPELKLTMQQAALPLRTGIVIGGQQQHNVPALRTMTLTMVDRAQIMDGVEFEYGASLESVTFFDRLNYVSPFARLTYEIGPGKLAFGYSSGAPPLELFYDAHEANASLQQDIAAMSLLPRVSLRNGRAHVQRTENLELGYELVLSSRTYNIGVFREIVRNGAVTIAGADDVIDGFDLLPELNSRSAVFNIGGYTRYGYSAAITQHLGDNYSVMLGYGSGGALQAADGPTVEADNAAELRDSIRRRQQRWVTVRGTAVVPGAGTRLIGSYQWADYRSLTPAHIYFTQRMVNDAGLNIRIRQPIPAFSGLPGRLEATAELRNMLAQGYLPVVTSAGRRMLLTHSPRAVRGGLSFIF